MSEPTAAEAIEKLQGQLEEAQDKLSCWQHTYDNLPEGFDIGDDATTELAVKLANLRMDCSTGIRQRVTAYREDNERLKDQLTAKDERIKDLEKWPGRVAGLMVTIGKKDKRIAALEDLLRRPMNDSCTTTGENGGPGCFFCDIEGGHADDCEAVAVAGDLEPTP